MKRMHWMIAPVLILCLAVPCGAAGETVGSFVERIARAKQIDPLDAKGAADSLRAAGVPLPTDLQLTQPLTEGHVATIARSLGLDVSTNRPDAPFSTAQVDRFFSAYRVDQALRGELPPRATTPVQNGPGFDPYVKGRGAGKGKRKGHGHTPTEPE